MRLKLIITKINHNSYKDAVEFAKKLNSIGIKTNSFKSMSFNITVSESKTYPNKKSIVPVINYLRNEKIEFYIVPKMVDDTQMFNYIFTEYDMSYLNSKQSLYG